jgi:hypothetical protein
MLAELVLGMAEQAHLRFGVSAAMGVLRAAIDRDLTADDRRTLLLRAMGLAILSNDRESFEAFAARWSTSGGDGAERRGLSLVARLHEDDCIELMSVLARAELARSRTPDALFVLATARERQRDLAAAERLFAESASLAALTGDAVRAARAERELLRVGRSTARDREGAAAFDSAPPREALRLAAAALTARGLYARVRVLDRLHELVLDPALRAAVVRIAVAHADGHGARLSAIERDRVLAILDRAAVDPAILALLREGAPVAEPFRARARAALSGNLLGPMPSETSERRDWLGLVVLAAIARGEPRSAVTPLVALAKHEPSSIAWTAALTALGQPLLRVEALACVERWIDRGVPPPRGYASLVKPLEHASAPALAERALEEAAVRSETGARARLAKKIEKRARDAYARGALEEARALAVRAIALE